MRSLRSTFLGGMVQPRLHVVRTPVATVASRDAVAIVGAVATVLAAAILYLCFVALALIDDA